MPCSMLILTWVGIIFVKILHLNIMPTHVKIRIEHRDRYGIPPKDLDSIMARFFLCVLKKDGTEYEPDSLGSMYNSLDRHLRDMKYTITESGMY